MLIDWFTVGAQAINFLILVWLMKHFLYKPILNAIAEREKKIATELANADKKKADAQKEESDFKHKNEVFDQDRAALLTKATDEAEAERQRLLDEARKAAAALSLKLEQTARTEEQTLHQALRRRTEQEVFAIARKALADLATTSLEERMGEVFTRRLREMNSQTKIALGGALKTGSAPGLIRSAFDLPAESRGAIQKALNETFSSQIRVRFETAPDLISGIELIANGQKVAWSIADYLASLENGVEELLKDREKRDVKSSDLTSQIAKRAYELYEQHGRKSDSANVDWSQAEREIRKSEDKTEPKAKPKEAPKPEAKVEPKPEPNPESKPEAKATTKPEAKVEPKTETKPAPKPETKVEPKPETKAEPKPEAKVEPKPEAKPDPKPEAKGEPKPVVKAEPKPEVKTEAKPEVKTEPKVETASK